MMVSRERLETEIDKIDTVSERQGWEGKWGVLSRKESVT